MKKVTGILLMMVLTGIALSGCYSRCDQPVPCYKDCVPCNPCNPCNPCRS